MLIFLWAGKELGLKLAVLLYVSLACLALWVLVGVMLIV